MPFCLCLSPSVTPQHAFHQIPQRTPEVFPARQLVFIDKQDVMLEARVEMRLQTQVNDNWVVMTVDVCVNSVKALEDLSD